jgi:NAD-dependent dihydropyrimidine dehydrogenase PreA subunit
MIEMPIIDIQKCDGCGLCVDVCHCHALILSENIVTVIATEDCDWCTECEIVCLTGALSCPFEIVIEQL